MAVASVTQWQSWGLTATLLDDADPTSWTVAEQAQVIQACQVLLNRLAAVQLDVIAAFDAAGGAQQLGARTTSAWLRATTRLDGPAAGSAVHTARALRNDLTHTAAALGQGRISVEHVRAIRVGHRRLGADFVDVEEMLADFAAQNTVRATRRLVDRMIDQYDPRGAADDAEIRREHRRAHLSQTFDGWWKLDALLDPATGEKLKAALDQYAAPTGRQDPREPRQRRADALGEIADRALALTDRTSGAAAVTITVTADQLHTGEGVHWPHGLRISRPDLALHTCTATVSYVIGMPTEQLAWEPLAVGIDQRYATRAQRRALAVRDGGCVHPGCTVRPERCLAHHIIHWRDGGRTDLSNLVLLCDYHHRQVHLGHEHVTIRNGHYTTTPPTTCTPIGPTRPNGRRITASWNESPFAQHLASPNGTATVTIRSVFRITGGAASNSTFSHSHASASRHRVDAWRSGTTRSMITCDVMRPRSATSTPRAQPTCGRSPG